VWAAHSLGKTGKQNRFYLAFFLFSFSLLFTSHSNSKTQREMEQFHQIASAKLQIVQTANQLVEREAILEIEKVRVGAHNGPNGKAFGAHSGAQ
jgi:hypothetical protein